MKIGEDLQAIWHQLEPTELTAKWLISELVAELIPPEEFLTRLLRGFGTAEKIGWIAAWLHLYLPYLAASGKSPHTGASS